MAHSWPCGHGLQNDSKKTNAIPLSEQRSCYHEKPLQQLKKWTLENVDAPDIWHGFTLLWHFADSDLPAQDPSSVLRVSVRLSGSRPRARWVLLSKHHTLQTVKSCQKKTWNAFEMNTRKWLLQLSTSQLCAPNAFPTAGRLQQLPSGSLWGRACKAQHLTCNSHYFKSTLGPETRQPFWTN